MRGDDRQAFVSEKISPVPGSADLSALARGEPGVPTAFVWRDQRYDVARTIEKRKDMGQDRGDTYVRRHYYDIETTDALRMTIYFDRNPTDRRKRRQWWLYTFSYPKPAIETPRLALRRWTWADRDAFQAMVSDPDVMRYVHDFRPLDGAETERALRATITHYSAGYGDWALSERDSDEIIGESGLTHLKESGDIEITWLLRRPAWGKGLGYEAARAVLEYAFGALDLQRLVADIRSDNERSIRLAEKLGLRATATFRHRLGVAMQRYAIERPRTIT